ncbi:MAG TPA: hypothetical protein VFN13_14145 [Rudaea sp.]|nr:hypothetical protein [Rudaea sp.]
MPMHKSFFARRRALWIVLIVFAVVAVGGWWLAHRTTVPNNFRFGRGAPGGFGASAMPVGVATAKIGDIAIYLDALGTVDVTAPAFELLALVRFGRHARVQREAADLAGTALPRIGITRQRLRARCLQTRRATVSQAASIALT